MTEDNSKDYSDRPDDEINDLSHVFRKYTGRQVSYCTHGIHRFPAKFIPQVPRFCMERYSEPGDVILDPFMGSGTTLLEAKLTGRSAYGIDIHPLAKLITKVKITQLPLAILHDTAEKLIADIREDKRPNGEWIPTMHNFDHWFRPNVARDLATIKKHIWALPDGDIKDFFKICFSSIIRRVSNSDSDSLIPEVTAFKRKLVSQGKADFDAIGRFINTVRLRIIDFEDLDKVLTRVSKANRNDTKVEIIGNDARDISLPDESVNLAITSPPYASAVHYVSVHKLEMNWLDLVRADPELDKRIVGTAKAYAEDYNNWEPGGLTSEVDNLIREIYENDRKSAYTVQRYFSDMQKNLREVGRVLCDGGMYCLIAGENVMKGTRIPTYQLLDKLAQEEGFKKLAAYNYDIINRHLDVPRWNNSTILKDHMLVLRK
ncbi:MAG: site-specific DNA-methyltransferase [Thermoplasmata archaeon]|nr:site-specific DNA-methyltransferase [Thermoplasmata archaeon]